ncbi:MAG: hypothetical protein DME17_01745 [Candidatus Rokuibacteriota bacterium]|nr:MAG: hypothetical protein DME17_01745 [Candidatus Rokubacteria bacterium]
MTDEVTVAISMTVPAAAYERAKVALRNGRSAGSDPWIVSTVRCPTARRPRSFASGLTGPTIAAEASTAGAAAPATITVSPGSRVTPRCYTTSTMETPVKVTELGHVSLYVRDLDASRHFYRDILGLTETGSGKGGRILFFSAGVHHHDLSCERAHTDGGGPPPRGAPGLYHIAFTVGRDHDDLARARRWVLAHGLTPFGEADTSFSIRDPDGTQIELTVNP